MSPEKVIQKIKKAGLKGRGGAEFPTALKWEMVRKVKAEKKYLIANGSEGEPKVFKDEFILKTHPFELIEGIKIAQETIKAAKAYLYLRKDFFQKYKKKLEKIIKEKNLPIIIFKKQGGYLCGEETTLVESLEGRRLEPRSRPPYPSEKGLWDCPTLINNVETLYYVSRIINNNYQGERLYSISGGDHPGVYELSADLSLKQVLKKTGNWPNFKFFVQVGGGASGEILLTRELNQTGSGLGAIIIYPEDKTNPVSLMKKWIDFFIQENCGKCSPCREGVYRLKELLSQKNPDQEIIKDLLFLLEKSSFCPFGKAMAQPFSSLIKKVGIFNKNK